MSTAPRPVRFTHAEVRHILLTLSDDGGKPHPLDVSVCGKLNAAVEVRTDVPGLQVRDAVGALEGVLGVGRVSLPPHTDGAWFARMTARLRQYRLTKEDMVKIARAVQGKRWAPPFSFERLVYGADRLLTEYTSGGTIRAPASMGDL